jgi:hypothetical protein
MRPRRTRWGLLIAAGLVWLLPTGSARAQYSYGYDSFVYYPPSQAYWGNAGFHSIYTDPTTGAFYNGSVAQNRTVVPPYANPPYGAFQQGNGLPRVSNRPLTSPSAVPARQPVVRQRRGLFGRLR